MRSSRGNSQCWNIWGQFEQPTPAPHWLGLCWTSSFSPTMRRNIRLSFTHPWQSPYEDSGRCFPIHPYLSTSWNWFSSMFFLPSISCTPRLRWYTPVGLVHLHSKSISWTSHRHSGEKHSTRLERQFFQRWLGQVWKARDGISQPPEDWRWSNHLHVPTASPSHIRLRAPSIVRPRRSSFRRLQSYGRYPALSISSARSHLGHSLDWEGGYLECRSPCEWYPVFSVFKKHATHTTP